MGTSGSSGDVGSPAAIPPPWRVPGQRPAVGRASGRRTGAAPQLSTPGVPGARGKGRGVCSPSVHLSVYPCILLSNTSINLSIHPSLVHICFSIQPSVHPPELSIRPSLPPPRRAARPGGLCLRTLADPPAPARCCHLRPGPRRMGRPVPSTQRAAPCGTPGTPPPAPLCPVLQRCRNTQAGQAKGSSARGRRPRQAGSGGGGQAPKTPHSSFPVPGCSQTPPPSQPAAAHGRVPGALAPR